jgi:transposase-like protein
MASKFKKVLARSLSSGRKVNENTLEKRYSARTIRSISRPDFDERLLALYRQGYLARQIAGLLGMELSDVNKQLRELPPVKVNRL